MKDQVAGLKEKGVKVEMLYEGSTNDHLKYVSHEEMLRPTVLMFRLNVKSRWDTPKFAYYT
jgi:hypothetical protein